MFNSPFEYIKAAAFGALGALIMFFLYEGIPGAYRIPYLSSIPIIGTFATGEKHAYAAEQVKTALKDMVSKAELDAANAIGEKYRRDAEFVSKQNEQMRQRAAVVQQSEKEQNERYDQITAEDTDDDGCRVGDSDIEWMSKHRSK